MLLLKKLGAGSLVGYDSDDGDVRGGEDFNGRDDHKGVEIRDR